MRFAAKRDANEAEVIATLQVHGWSVFQMSQKGFPDLLCVWGGVAVRLVEVKMPKGSLTEAQEVTFAALEKAGMPVCVVRSGAEAILMLGKHPVTVCAGVET